MEFVRLVGFRAAAFILHGEGEPKPFLPVEWDSLWRGVKFHHIALAGQTQRMGGNREAAEDQQIAPALPQGGVMRPLMEQIPFYGAQIFLPLLFQMDKSPLPAAESKMLKAGEREEVFLTVGHPIRRQATPEGRADSSTDTV